MQLLPIIIIVSLLGFFIMLTLVLFTLQCLRTREQRRRRQSSGSGPHYRPTRKLTLQSGKAIPTAEAQDTASTRGPHSLDMTSPMPTYTVKCEARQRSSSQSRPMISAQDHGHPPILTDLEAQTHKQHTEGPRRAVSEPNRAKEKLPSTRVYSIPSNLMTERNGSLTIPRPALVTIESRRPSATTRSSESPPQRASEPMEEEAQPRRSSASKGQEISNSLQKAFQGPLFLSGQAHDMPASPLVWNSSIHAAESRRASERRPSGPTLGSPTVSSRIISDSIEKPPPLFSGVSHSPRTVRFAPPTKIDVNRISFLSMTDSASSSGASEQWSPISPVAPTMRAPPPSTVELAHYSPSPPRSSGIGSKFRPSPPPLRNTPPHLETPDFGHISFFDDATSSDELTPLKRGVSVMSNRSNFTIASSEISSDWTIGNAKVVNIYPSVAQERERTTPPYAHKLRSKYGRYPRGRRDKALPGVPPKSPLWQTEFGPR